MRNTLYTIITSAVIYLFGMGTAFAAPLDLVNISTLPASPGALETVVVRLESFAVNLNSANIVWNVDKIFTKDGVGEKEITITTPEFGQKITIDIIIITREGERIDKKYIIAPGEVDLLWEAQTYTPPFYKGKALPTFNSLIRVTAIPRFNSLTSSPKDYDYKWTYNRTQGLGEGLGKNSVVVPMGYADSQVPIKVDVGFSGSDWKGSKNISISGSSPKIVLYAHDPLLGVGFHQAIPTKGSHTSKETESTIFAAPYFFSLDNLLNNQLIYTWEVDRKYTSPGLSPRYLTVVRPTNGVGSYALSLRIQNPNRILQEGRASAQISFIAE